ncbi:hypothetical protein [uncultured Kordia sp.]|uniref:hypothetical protein n=1 Tax=uncultured Kordia sp. TaxID=507699 RepID=UPI0026132907|nr:hypothetical protein [uncultured Kordia sp.]
MIKYLICSIILLASCSNIERIEYRLTHPDDAGEQYLTIIESDVYYHGKAHKISTDSTKTSFTYFLSKAVNKGPDQNGIDNLVFYDFQYSDELLEVTDFDSSKLNKSVLISFDIYNSMWGELSGDTISLKATKHIYDSRSDKIIFTKMK